MGSPQCGQKTAALQDSSGERPRGRRSVAAPLAGAAPGAEMSARIHDGKAMALHSFRMDFNNSPEMENYCSISWRNILS